MADYFVSVDSRYQDFIVFNGDEPLSDEEILDADISFGELKDIDNLHSAAWSSHCKYFFIMQPDCIYLVKTLNDKVVRCNKKSSKFIEMYLNIINRRKQNSKLAKIIIRDSKEK